MPAVAMLLDNLILMYKKQRLGNYTNRVTCYHNANGVPHCSSETIREKGDVQSYLASPCLMNHPQTFQIS